MADIAEKNLQLENDYLTLLHADLDKICSSAVSADGNSQLEADAFILYL